jgi:hypothetical protein
MRVYGRVRDPLTGRKTWVTVITDPRGFNDNVYLTALVQCIKLNWGESPFYSNWGIPAHQSVMSQQPPDYAMTLMQQRYSPHFMSLILSKQADVLDERGALTPAYLISLIYNWGAKLSTVVTTPGLPPQVPV